MAEQPLVKKDALTSKTVAKCLDFYPDVLKAVYQSTRPKLDQARIIDNDQWRYDLSKQVQGWEGLSKSELARLVQWKITHGTYRPFLPSMVDKNSPEEVQARTKAAAKLIDEIDRKTAKAEIVAAVNKALAEVCKLKGVGPATGTLVLSVFKPDIVPFFQDESFYWATDDYDKKLEYDKKEYNAMLEEVLELSLRLNVDVIKLEKTAYVLSHAKELGEKQRKQLEQSGSLKAEPVKLFQDATESTESTESKGAPTETKKRKRPVATSEDKAVSTSPKVEHVEDAAPRRSKRHKP